MKILGLISIIALVSYANSLHAIEPITQHIGTPSSIEGHTWVQPSGNDLLVNIPSPALSDVKDQIYKAQSNLTARQSKLVLAVKEKEFSLKDGLITLILPGGFFYAAAIQRSHVQAKNELSKITNQLNEINDDISNLATYEQLPHGILIAHN